MSERSDGKRALRCPSCSARILIPIDTASGARARCGVCAQLFRVPASPPPRADSDAIRRTATKVKMLDVNDMPEQLRRELARRRQTDTAPETPPQPTSQPEDAGPALGKDEAARRAFDLGEGGDPIRRSGAGMVNVADLLKAMGESDDPEE